MTRRASALEAPGVALGKVRRTLPVRRKASSPPPAEFGQEQLIELLAPLIAPEESVAGPAADGGA